MKPDLLRHSRMLEDNHACIMYRGPIRAEKLEAFAEMLQKWLDLEGVPSGAAQSVFSVFIEQMNNMIMHSSDNEHTGNAGGKCSETSKGSFIIGMRDRAYFLQSGNVMENSHVESLKSRIDFLNTLNKDELQQYYHQRIKAENDNPASKGAGLGLIEIAKRATSRIDYEFTAYGGDLSYFTMYVTV